MTIEKRDYKKTVHLPKTDFPMKAGLPEFEPKKLKEWEAENLYLRTRALMKGRPKYILHDGPPYANGSTHIGHALNKIIKDFIVKYKTMRGYDAHYVPGWDCHGMPIEHAIFKELGKRKEDVDQLEFRKKARAYAEKYISIQREEFKRLGIFGDWNEPYLTMKPEYQAKIAESFLALCEKGFIYQGLKPVPWCYDCETALADAELEYEDKVSPSVYAAFDILNTTEPANLKIMSVAKGRPAFVIVWTTTPWTLPANVAIAFHPELIYSVFEVGGKVFIAASSLVPALKAKFGLADIKQLSELKGRDLKGLSAKRPFSSEVSVGVLADYVSAADGTGVVHIAPGHGEEDYEVGLEYKLPILSPVDEKGRFTSDFKEAAGVHVAKANKKIIELLRENKALLFQEDHPHSYPHCWRCKNPIIFRATKQWFLKMDHLDLRKRVTKAINEHVRFYPDWGKNRIGSMVELRPDWCLSRQRLWGVPIPIISCAKCAKTFASESKTRIIERFVKDSSDVWFSEKPESFLPAHFKCPCGSGEFKKETDIIDVWFDSGVSHQAVLRSKNYDLKFPADMYLEGSDQHRGWFQSALITAMALEERAPFESILTHGFVVDGEGKKMSKSAGNVVAPQDVMKEFGADILRLWVASCDYSQDVRLSKEILSRMADAYRKIRNTFRYLLANLFDFDPKQHLMKRAEWEPIDQYIWAKARTTFRKAEEGFDAYNFNQAFQEIYALCNVSLSSYYLDTAKDRLYTAGQNSRQRRSAQSAIFLIARDLAKVCSPILCFTADQVWQFFAFGQEKSVHESEWPNAQAQEAWEDQILADWDVVHAAHKVILSKLEEKRSAGDIAASLDAHVELLIRDKKQFDVLNRYAEKLRFYFIISSFQLTLSENAQEAIDAQVTRASGVKCVRCWNYSKQVGTFDEHPELCERCVEALAT